MPSIIDQLYRLNETEFSRLYAAHGAEVREYDHYRWLHLGGDLIQSAVDCHAPERLLNPVNASMLTALVFLPQYRSILNLGFGGGAFERFFGKYLPDSNVDSVESDEIVIHLAREFFFIDLECPVYLQSAEQFLTGCDQQYDLILCDLFAEEKHPASFYDTDFYRGCQRCLHAHGVLVMNLIPADERDMTAILLPLRQSFRYSGLLQLPDHDNAILFASNQAFRSDHAVVVPQLDIDLTGYIEQIHWLPEQSD